MRRAIFIAVIFFVSGLNSIAQPKLVVGIVIDQMRYDYLLRFKQHYSDSGFNKLVAQGESWQNMNYNYIPTFTGPGHASIYTGTTPAFHGIAANDWYDRNSGKMVYCTEDNHVKAVGEKESKGMSPHHLRVPTLGDQLKSVYPESKVYGIALKDRGGILPAGKKADAAYWYDGKSGCMISSTFYQPSLPKWVIEFNKNNHAQNYLKQNWSLMMDDSIYPLQWDNLSYERPFKGENLPIFPHEIAKIKGDNSYDILKSLPFGNTYTFDFAKKLIDSENLGKDNIPDLLCVSLSSTDYIGHQFGTQSLEVMDTYLRLDRDLANFISFLNSRIGKDNYVLFLSSDHGAAEHPYHLNDSCFYNISEITQQLKSGLQKAFGDTLIEFSVNDQLYVNQSQLVKRNLSKKAIIEWINENLKNQPSFLMAVAPEIGNCELDEQWCNFVKNGSDTERSGDVWLIFRPGCIPESYRKGGTTHGTCYHYDTHVPFIVYGNGIKFGSHVDNAKITDIAPTIAELIGIMAPQGSSGRSLLKK